MALPCHDVPTFPPHTYPNGALRRASGGAGRKGKAKAKTKGEAKAEPKTETYDIVVYGGTSGGITAGIQAVRMGKTVVIIEPTKFLGGLTTGGLGATDIGNKKAIGGMSREFYHRVWQHYQRDQSWVQQKREEYVAKRHGGNTPNEETMWTFEPHVATKIYDEMIAETKVPVCMGSAWTSRTESRRREPVSRRS